jgi:hypothetical protein
MSKYAKICLNDNEFCNINNLDQWEKNHRFISCTLLLLEQDKIYEENLDIMKPLFPFFRKLLYLCGSPRLANEIYFFYDYLIDGKY